MTTEILISFFHELFWFIVFLLIVDHVFLDGVFTKKITSIKKGKTDEDNEEIESLKQEVKELEEQVKNLEERVNHQENKINL